MVKFDVDKKKLNVNGVLGLHLGVSISGSTFLHPRVPYGVGAFAPIRLSLPFSVLRVAIYLMRHTP